MYVLCNVHVSMREIEKRKLKKKKKKLITKPDTEYSLHTDKRQAVCDGIFGTQINGKIKVIADVSYEWRLPYMRLKFIFDKSVERHLS